MRISYLLHWNEPRASGVVAKVNRQISSWEAAGHEAAVFLVTREADIGTWREVLGHVDGRRPVFVFGYASARGRLSAWLRAARMIRRSAFDIVYHRHNFISPAIGWLARTTPIVYEVNSDDVAEYCRRPGLRCVLNRLTRTLYLSFAAGVVFISKELQDSRRFASLKCPTSVIPNGYDLSAALPFPAPMNPSPRLIFVASDSHRWQGIDKVLRLAERHPEWRFDVVGPISRSEDGGAANVTFHGRLEKAQYLDLLASADVGLGTLALHRKGLEENSPLKVREYLAYGLPVITAYLDSDFPDPVPFILRLPNTEGNVESSAKEIEAFVETSSSRRPPREAVHHIDAMAKEQNRLAFMRTVAGR